MFEYAAFEVLGTFPSAAKSKLEYDQKRISLVEKCFCALDHFFLQACLTV